METSKKKLTGNAPRSNNGPVRYILMNYYCYYYYNPSKIDWKFSHQTVDVCEEINA